MVFQTNVHHFVFDEWFFFKYYHAVVCYVVLENWLVIFTRLCCWHFKILMSLPLLSPRPSVHIFCQVSTPNKPQWTTAFLNSKFCISSLSVVQKKSFVYHNRCRLSVRTEHCGHNAVWMFFRQQYCCSWLSVWDCDQMDHRLKLILWMSDTCAVQSLNHMPHGFSTLCHIATMPYP